MSTIRWPLGLAPALLGAALSVAGCSRSEAPAPAATASNASSPAAGIVPPPPGDATPIPADSDRRAAVQSNEKTGASGPQSTVSSAAAGAPPYTLNSAPEGNKDSTAGTKAADEPKK